MRWPVRQSSQHRRCTGRRNRSPCRTWRPRPCCSRLPFCCLMAYSLRYVSAVIPSGLLTRHLVYIACLHRCGQSRLMPLMP